MAPITATTTGKAIQATKGTRRLVAAAAAKPKVITTATAPKPIRVYPSVPTLSSISVMELPPKFDLFVPKQR